MELYRGDFFFFGGGGAQDNISVLKLSYYIGAATSSSWLLFQLSAGWTVAMLGFTAMALCLCTVSWLCTECDSSFKNEEQMDNGQSLDLHQHCPALL